MPTLTAAIHSLAESFAAGVLQAIRNSSLEELLGETTGKRGRGARSAAAGSARGGMALGSAEALRGRRSLEDIENAAAKIVSFVKSHPGSNAEQIRAELEIAKNHWMRPLDLALSTGRLTKKGQKRSTKYFAK